MPRTATVWPEFDAHLALADPITLTTTVIDFAPISGTASGAGSPDNYAGSVTLTTTTPNFATVATTANPSANRSGSTSITTSAVSTPAIAGTKDYPARTGSVTLYTTTISTPAITGFKEYPARSGGTVTLTTTTPGFTVFGYKDYPGRFGSTTLTANSPTVSVLGKKVITAPLITLTAAASHTLGPGVKKAAGPVSLSVTVNTPPYLGYKTAITPSSNKAILAATLTGSLQPVIIGSFYAPATATGSLSGVKRAVCPLVPGHLASSAEFLGTHLARGVFNPTLYPGEFLPGAKIAINHVENPVTLRAICTGRLHETLLPPYVSRPRIRVLKAPAVYDPDPDLDSSTLPPELAPSPF